MSTTTSAIEWTDAWHVQSAASRLGISVQEYTEKRRQGEKWCTSCKAWHAISQFGIDKKRSDGFATSCLFSRRVTEKKPPQKRGRRGWLKPTRDGDKKQARRRVNYLVEQNLIPHPDELPCFDCFDEVFSGVYRHEYDHAKGYVGENQLYVEPVCSKCHHNREDARRG